MRQFRIRNSEHFKGFSLSAQSRSKVKKKTAKILNCGDAKESKKGFTQSVQRASDRCRGTFSFPYDAYPSLLFLLLKECDYRNSASFYMQAFQNRHRKYYLCWKKAKRSKTRKQSNVPAHHRGIGLDVTF